MTILEKIIADKQREVVIKKRILPLHQLEASVLFNSPTNSFKKQLVNTPVGIIAEHKRRSPSKKEINYSHTVEEVVKGYEINGAAGISVLTDGKHFGGSLEDVLQAKGTTSLPLLRKEFIVDEYQIIEAKAYGADAILLIASALNKREIEVFSKLAKSLSLEVLLEIHNQEELEKRALSNIDLIGINNRNLKTFEVNLNTSKFLAEKIPDGFIKISESGIHSAKEILELQTYGFKGFLMGEHFMKTDNPGNALKFLMDSIKKESKTQ